MPFLSLVAAVCEYLPEFQQLPPGTRLVTQGTEDDDAEGNDDGMQQSDESAGNDSDYDAEKDAREQSRDAKKFQKTKKLAKQAGSD